MTDAERRLAFMDGLQRRDIRLCGSGGMSLEYYKERRSAEDLRTTLTNYRVEDRGHETPCWIWQRGKTSAGYGELSCRGVGLYAHRVSYQMHRGPIPKGLFVLHRCDNPPCIRPDHLFVGTNADNMLDMWAKGRCIHFNSAKTHCKHGHEFSKENTYFYPDGKRACKTCVREAKRRYRERLRQARIAGEAKRVALEEAAARPHYFYGDGLYEDAS